jgi:hypothetical protein
MLPFGKRKGKALGDVPTDYLLWTLRGCKLNTGLRAAVAGELVRRGGAVPPPPPPPRIQCSDCLSASEPRFIWQEDRAGRRRGAECQGCQRFITFAPTCPPYTTEADRRASPTPVLDALVLAEEEGIGLRSDGEAVTFATPHDRSRAPERLRDLLRKANHVLGSMMGRQSP